MHPVETPLSTSSRMSQKAFCQTGARVNVTAPKSKPVRNQATYTQPKVHTMPDVSSPMATERGDCSVRAAAGTRGNFRGSQIFERFASDGPVISLEQYEDQRSGAENREARFA